MIKADTAFSSGCQNLNCLYPKSEYDTKDASALGVAAACTQISGNGNLAAGAITWHKIHFRNF